MAIYFASFLSISPDFTHNPLFLSPIFFLNHTFATVSPTQKEKRTIKPNSWSKSIPKLSMAVIRVDIPIINKKNTQTHLDKIQEFLHSNL